MPLWNRVLGRRDEGDSSTAEEVEGEPATEDGVDSCDVEDPDAAAVSASVDEASSNAREETALSRALSEAGTFAPPRGDASLDGGPDDVAGESSWDLVLEDAGESAPKSLPELLLSCAACTP